MKKDLVEQLTHVVMTLLTTSIIVAIAIMFTGCASDTQMQMAYDSQIAVAQSQSNNTQTPTLTIKCGSDTEHCHNLEVSYLDPRDRSNVVIPSVTNQNDVVIKTLPSAFSMVKWLGGFWAATKVFDSMVDSTTNDTYMTSTSVSGENNSLNMGEIDFNNNSFTPVFESIAPEVTP